MAEITEREEIGLRATYRDPGVLQAAGFPLYGEIVKRANRRAFIDTFKIKIPQQSSVFILPGKGAKIFSALFACGCE